MGPSDLLPWPSLAEISRPARREIMAQIVIRIPTKIFLMLFVVPLKTLLKSLLLTIFPVTGFFCPPITYSKQDTPFSPAKKEKVQKYFCGWGWGQILVKLY